MIQIPMVLMCLSDSIGIKAGQTHDFGSLYYGLLRKQHRTRNGNGTKYGVFFLENASFCRCYGETE